MGERWNLAVLFIIISSDGWILNENTNRFSLFSNDSNLWNWATVRPQWQIGADTVDSCQNHARKYYSIEGKEEKKTVTERIDFPVNFAEHIDLGNVESSQYVENCIQWTTDAFDIIGNGGSNENPSCCLR